MKYVMYIALLVLDILYIVIVFIYIQKNKK